MAAARKEDQPAEAVVIKKYANRRLYNTASSSYVTLDHLSEMVRSGVDFAVQDAKTGEDITRSVLAQIIFEQESRGQNLLPATFLRRLIRFYGDSMQTFLPAYLELSMETFSKSQEQMREQFSRAFQGKPGLPGIGAMASFEDQARQNMAMFEQALRLWAPFAAGAAAPSVEPRPEPKPEPKVETEAMAAMRRQLEAMQKQLDELSAERGRKP